MVISLPNDTSGCSESMGKSPDARSVVHSETSSTEDNMTETCPDCDSELRDCEDKEPAEYFCPGCGVYMDVGGWGTTIVGT